MPPHLFGLLPEQLLAAFDAEGEALRLDEARRALSAAVAQGRLDLSGVRPLSKQTRERLDRLTRRDPLTVLERVEDPEDGSLRTLFQAEDGAIFESVRIPLLVPGRYTVCLSSQAGCAMGCVFCATGRLGLRRDLAAWEIVAQWWDAARKEGRVSGAVFMGQGEPLHNESEVLAAARVLCSPTGGRIRAEAITISTVGLVPQIRRYTAARHPYRLIVSLSSAVPERRASLLPVAGRTPLPQLVEALSEHAAATGERVTLAWVLLGGVNTGPDEIEALAAIAERVPLRLDLVDVNDLRPHGHRRATDREREAFLDGLRRVGIPFIRRYSVGRGQHSACGMLAGQRLGPSP